MVTANTPGRFFQLEAGNLGSLDYGTPIFFRRIQVGQVTSYRSGQDDGHGLTVQIFVKAPYDRFVKPETRFWQASGLDFSLNADGLKVQTQSLTSLLIGGVAFDTPTEGAEADPAAAATRFELFGDQATAMKAPERRAIHYVLYFDESVRGLSPGAPVTLLGLPIGEVVSVRLEAGSRKDLKVRARVRVATFPAAFSRCARGPAGLDRGQGDHPGDTAGSHRPPGGARPARAVADGQPAHWSQLYVALAYVPNEASATIDWKADPAVFPVAKSGLTDIEAKLTSILTKLDRLPIDAIGSDLKQSLATLAGTLKEVDTLVKRWGGEFTPELNSALVEGRRTLAAAERSFDAAGKAVAPDSV